VSHNNPARAGHTGTSLKEDQDGIYLQTIYGFAPRWRAGLRGEITGLTNKQTKPSGAKQSFNRLAWAESPTWINIVVASHAEHGYEKSSRG